jgi:signal peptidase II
MTASKEYQPSAFSLFVWRQKLLFLIGIMLISVAVDQATKVWAQERLATPRTIPVTQVVDGEPVTTEKVVYRHSDTIEIVPDFFNFIYRENPAAAFSLTISFPEWFRRPFLVSVSAICFIFLLIWYFRYPMPDGLFMTALSLIAGGAVGNLIDRVRLAYVIDFLDVYAGFIDPGWPHYPTFNIADSCIVVGAILIFWRTFFPLPEPDKEQEIVKEDSSTESLA